MPIETRQGFDSVLSKETAFLRERSQPALETVLLVS